METTFVFFYILLILDFPFIFIVHNLGLVEFYHRLKCNVDEIEKIGPRMHRAFFIVYLIGAIYSFITFLMNLYAIRCTQLYLCLELPKVNITMESLCIFFLISFVFHLLVCVFVCLLDEKFKIDFSKYTKKIKTNKINTKKINEIIEALKKDFKEINKLLTKRFKEVKNIVLKKYKEIKKFVIKKYREIKIVILKKYKSLELSNNKSDKIVYRKNKRV